MRAALAAGIVLAVGAWARAASALSALEGYDGTRPLGMAGAGRAWAVGDTGPMLNPSGMSLIKAYTLEAAYAHGSAAGGINIFHGSVVDSTSEVNLAGGLSYTYLANSPGGVGGAAHEVVAALAFPFTESVALGGGLRYVYATGGERRPDRSGGFTFDLGTTVRPSPEVALALVGANLT